MKVIGYNHLSYAIFLWILVWLYLKFGQFRYNVPKEAGILFPTVFGRIISYCSDLSIFCPIKATNS